MHVINPIALSHAEMYGAMDSATGQWHDGVLAHLLRRACCAEGAGQHWLLLDGPVDAVWVESMHSLLDSCRVLTLLSGERLAMPPQVRSCPGTKCAATTLGARVQYLTTLHQHSPLSQSQWGLQ